MAERRRNAVVVADHDKPVAQFDGMGTGEFYARRTGLPWAMPPVLGTDANDYHLAAGLPALQGLLLDLTKRLPREAGHAQRRAAHATGI
jgi:putative DNA primase/helicase